MMGLIACLLCVSLIKHLIIEVKDFSFVEYDEQLEDQLKPSSPMNSWSIHPHIKFPKMNAVLNDGEELNRKNHRNVIAACLILP